MTVHRGTKKKRTLPDAYSWLLDLPAGPETEAKLKEALLSGKLKYADVVAIGQMKAAASGKTVAAAEIADRTTGRVGPQEGRGGNSLVSRLLEAFEPPELASGDPKLLGSSDEDPYVDATVVKVEESTDPDLGMPEVD